MAIPTIMVPGRRIKLGLGDRMRLYTVPFRLKDTLQRATGCRSLVKRDRDFLEVAESSPTDNFAPIRPRGSAESWGSNASADCTVGEGGYEAPRGSGTDRVQEKDLRVG